VDKDGGYMPQEIEAKFLHANHDEVRAKLKAVGATLERPLRLMRRTMIDHADDRFQSDHKQQLRVRDEGDKITLTYKKSGTDSHYAHELETTVGSFEALVKIMEAIGLHAYSYQESKRETWHLDDVEVVLDEWPWIDTFVEVEGPSELAIKTAAVKLGFSWEDARFGNVDMIYRTQYPGMQGNDSIGYIPELRFDAPLPDYLKGRR